MTFTVAQKTKILSLKSAIASYYSLQMKKIGDRPLESFFHDECIITGGCIASLFHNEHVNDIDVYAKDARKMLHIKEYILGNGKNIKSTKGYPPDALDIPTRPLVTDNAVTLTNDVQFVYLGSAEECRKKFDFIHCMPWFDIKTQKLYISEAQYLAIETKTLVLNISGEAVKDRRIQKYTDKGWKLKEVLSPSTMYFNS